MSHLISIDILERIAVALEKLVEGPRLVGFDEKGQPDNFFDAFPDGIQIDWNKIDSNTLDSMLQSLSEQKVETIFSELQECINTNEKRRTIIDVTLKVLEVAISLGMKIK